MGEETGSLQAFAEARLQALVHRTLMENLEQGVFVLDTELRYRAMNRCMAGWLGVREDEVLGRTVFDVHPGPRAARYAADLRQALRGEPVEREEQLLVGGKFHTQRLFAVPLRDHGGRVLGLLALCWSAIGAEEGRSAAPRPAHGEGQGPRNGHGLRDLLMLERQKASPGAADPDAQVQVGKLSLEQPEEPFAHVPRIAECKTLLLVDREPALRALFRLILEKEGYRVLLAADRRQALEVLRGNAVPIALLILEHAPVCTNFDCLSDLRLPRTEVPILLVGQEGLANHCKPPARVRGLLNKPFHPEQLVLAVRGILRSDEGPNYKSRTWETWPPV